MMLVVPTQDLRAQFATNYDSAGRDQRNPDKWKSLAEVGARALEDKKFDLAIKFLNAALATNPKPIAAAYIYGLRARAYSGKGEKEKARADYRRALGVPPKDSGDYVDHARLHRKMGDYRAAGDAFRKATKILPKKANVWNSLAWFLATVPAKEARNGREAVEAASKACELTNWKKNDYLDTLAAAYAEAGEFEQAVKYQERALRTGFIPREDRRGFEARLAQYRQRKPYRDPD